MTYISSNEARELLCVAYDLHIHTLPDITSRKLSATDAVRQAREAGMAGIALKSHVMSTVSAAVVLNEMYSDFHTVSGLVLNSQVGGLNPWAVEAFGKMEGELLWFPTLDAENYVAWKHSIGVNAPDRDMMKLADEGNAMLPAAAAVLDLAVKYDLTVGTGHLSPNESVLCIREASVRGVKRMWVTHVTLPCCRLSLEQQKECVAHGALIEFSYGHVIHKQCALEDFLNGIHAIGVENAVLTTDSGQANAPVPVEVLVQAIDVLLQSGFSSTEVDTLIKVNPQKLLRRR